VPATTLHALVEARVRQDPEAVCAVHGERRLRRLELDTRANRLARRLVALGVGPGRFVPIVVRRGLDFVVAMLAVWKAGGAYVPVDPTYPEERVRLMLEDCDAEVAIVGAAALARFGTALSACPALRHVVCQREAARAPGALFSLHGPAELAAEDLAAPPPRATPRDAAYMVYTSGSTGRPKGAIVRHDGAVNHLFAQAHALGEAAIARFLQSAPSSSDISVWQFAAPLAFGGCTVILDDATDVAALLLAVRTHGLHLIELVPAVLKYLCEYAAALPEAERALPSLRWAMVTGESAPVALVNAWLALYPGVPVVNAYGPTEAADDVTQAVIAAPLSPRQATVPIGRPLANLDLYVLDERLRPLPVGAPGELCVAGVGVGDGYWHQPGKTAAAFVPNPFDGAAGPVIYRTGDLARWRDDGSLECGGRLDHQVQIRGQRIELAEIEAQLRRHPALADVVVQAFHDGEGDGRLVAFVVARDEVDDAALRAGLAARLPAAMLPSAFVRLDALPLNPAGKVDRHALRPPPARATSGKGRAPSTALEALLARLGA
ncbi:amino acid adenylation domain-containing protein, partial [Rubrivivax gelatinosus]|uniref:amino acid adenylation domain-containing protein n=1 Tax=Rubrivivax gelatinosus TaxID=28068 RepID=UPI0005C13106